MWHDLVKFTHCCVIFDLCRALRCSFAAERLAREKDPEKMLPTKELQLPYLYLFLCHYVSGLRFAYNSQTDVFYKFIALNLKRKFLFSNFGCKKWNLMEGEYFSSLFRWFIQIFCDFRISVLVLAALLLGLMIIEWIFVWCITLLNDQRYWSKVIE